MLDKVTVTPRTRQEIPGFPLAGDEVAAIDVIPQPGRTVPWRPFLHRGDWMDDGQGNVWTVLSALLHEDDDNDGEPYLWHEYEVVNGMRKL